MPADPRHDVGQNIATLRRLRNRTQQELADTSGVSYHMVRSVERGARAPSEHVLDALAAALAVDPSRLLGHRARSDSRVHEELPVLSRAIATYDVPEDGPVRALPELHSAVSEAVSWRVGAQYLRISRQIPTLLGELSRALHAASGTERVEVARLLVAAYRSADAVAYKFGERDLSARLVELMRWAAPAAEDPLLDAAVAYVRTETFFAARAHDSGLRALEHALDAAPAPDTGPSKVARGALHMRAAVIAGRAGRADSAALHLDEAHRLGDEVPEGVYEGTAFGPSSVRIHEVSVAVSLGDAHLQRALDIAHEWAPPPELPAERRSGFYIEVARAQLWAGLRDDAFESLKVARRFAPQHTREHPWVREDVATLRRIKRADREDLSNFAGWCQAA
ncbi:helix-turn-helix domain-containing protein [Streptomyces sp. NBC_01775]|uniref:helix-turn-helix domain-containing protein n=1 Tax=Streptomyces sp. NBC_01775 TaxID=2975939 RepID=UPI002DD9ED87|nr:helix-turn-helix transcriptional regulator [Streptomyces sp. NBC_01775]WSB80367.1 helix-turn-helix domain-containing protein [Streptomyces sp. NBC_01775]